MQGAQRVSDLKPMHLQQQSHPPTRGVGRNIPATKLDHRPTDDKEGRSSTKTSVSHLLWSLGGLRDAKAPLPLLLLLHG